MSMADAGESLLVTLEGAVGRITLNRPAELNALTPEMLLGIPKALAQLVDRGARAILITGSGRGFCSGAALGQRGPDPIDLAERIGTYYNPMARALADCPVPVVTAINGAAAGAGASIALAGDIVVAARSAYLMLAFARVGLVPDGGATWLVANSAGRLKALEMALLGEKLRAEEALACGLVTRVVDDEALLETAASLADRLAALPTVAMGLIRRQIRIALDDGLEATLEAERAHQARAGFTEDHAEGVQAFKEKRPAIFRGR
jgi:2-(1,2-epoxy-1,2-dihydrophenyl)acetyl-CoA isomerase